MTIKRLPTLAISVSILVLVACSNGNDQIDRSPTQAETLPPAHIAVDFANEQGPLLHTERYNNFHVSTTFAAQRDADVDFLNANGLHGVIYRAWLNSPNQTESTCTNPDPQASEPCILSPSMDAYLTDLENVSDAQIGNLRLDAWIGQDTAVAKAKMERILLAVKQGHPEMQLIEAWNEPDAPSSIITAAQVYAGYKALYQAVNGVNTTLGGEPGYTPLKVGGPASFYFNKTLLNAFLDAYIADTDPNKRLDFISYHLYLHTLADGTREFFKSDPSLVKNFRNELDALLTARNLPQNLPAYVTETGIYPGPLCDACDSTDYIRTAAGMPSLHYWVSQQHDTYPFNWVARRQGLKDEFVTNYSVGPYASGLTILWQPYTPPPTDALTPYGNVLLMQSKMKDTKVSAISDQINNGIGVYAVAAKDANKPEASVMVWNYQGCPNLPPDPACPTAAYHATINMTQLPEELANGSVNVTAYRVDQNTSNFFSDPNTANFPAEEELARAILQQVDQRTVKPNKGELRYEADLPPNTVYLILLGKVSQ